jgi:hypothetical protein
MRAGKAKARQPMRGGGEATTGGVGTGEEAQAALCCCGRGEGECSGRLGRHGRLVGVKEAGTSHPSIMGSGSEAGGSDASTANGAGTSGAQIRADGVEHPRTFG